MSSNQNQQKIRILFTEIKRYQGFARDFEGNKDSENYQEKINQLQNQIENQTQNLLENINLYPIDTILLGQYGQYQFQLYDDIDLSNPPIMGVDVSGALMQDSSAITIIDSKTTKTVGTLNCNYITSDDLADAIYTLITRYFPNCVASIERNGGYGVSVIQRLCKTSVKKNLSAVNVSIPASQL